MDFYIKNKYANVKISIALFVIGKKYSLQTENLYLNSYLMVIFGIFFPHQPSHEYIAQLVACEHMKSHEYFCFFSEVIYHQFFIQIVKLKYSAQDISCDKNQNQGKCNSIPSVNFLTIQLDPVYQFVSSFSCCNASHCTYSKQ